MKKLLKLICEPITIFFIGSAIFAAILSFDASITVFGFLIFSILGFGCFVLCYDLIEKMIKNAKNLETLKGFLPLAFYLFAGCFCFYLSYGAISELLNL